MFHNYKDIFLSVFVKGLSICLVFIFTAIVTKNSSVLDAGTFFWAVGFIQLFSGLSKIGLDSALVKVISIEPKISNTFFFATFVVFLIICLISLGLAFFGGFLGNNQTVLLIIVGLFFVTFNSLFSQLNLSKGSVKLSLLMVGVFPYLIFIIIFFFLRNNPMDYLALLMLFCFSYMVPFLFNAVINKKFVKLSFSITTKIRSLFNTASKLMLVSWGMILQNWLGIIILGVFSKVDVAHYNVANKVALTLSVILIGLNTYLSPKLAIAFSVNDNKAIKDLIRLAYTVTSVVGTVLFVILFTNLTFLLSLFGEEYINSILIAKILLLSQFINLLSGPTGPLLIMSNQEDIFMKISLVSIVLYIICMLLLVPSLGSVGMAYATLTWVSVQSVLSLYVFFTNYSKVK
jgi:O-antigen/teichoic acid export membrane protein